MIIIDTGPLVSLFNPKDNDHKSCHQILKQLTDSLYTTEAVLTEVFHMLHPASRGAEGVKQFVLSGYVTLEKLNKEDVQQSFSLMDQYADLPMDFADATLLALAHRLKIQKVFTLDLSDFSIYRIKKGHQYYPLDLIGRDMLN